MNTLLFDIPFSKVHSAFRAIGSAFLIFDIILFLSLFVLLLFFFQTFRFKAHSLHHPQSSLISIVRYSLYPSIFWVMLSNETHSLFLGTIPMGLVTIVTGIARTGNEYGLTWTLDLCLVLWWLSLCISMGTSFGVPYVS